MPSHSLLQRLQRFSRSSSGFPDQLANVLYGEEYLQSVADLQDDDLMWLVDYLDEVRWCVIFPSLRLNQAGSRQSRSCQFRLPEMSPRTEKYMRHQDDPTDLVHSFA
jgi:hypothetical protein